MSFFKDLKEDIAQSLDELSESLDDTMAAPEESEELSPSDIAAAARAALAEEAGIDVIASEPAPEEPVKEPVAEETADEEPEVLELLPEEPEEEPAAEEEPAPKQAELPVEEVVMPEPIHDFSGYDAAKLAREVDMKGDRTMSTMEPEITNPSVDDENPNEVTVITKGTTISGGIKSDTSLVVKGTIEGDVECQGKLTITGRVAGNTIASEIYVNTPRLEGDINSKGIVKIDVGTVVIGNINCTSVVVAGAVKGDIEVNGPVVIDSTAVVKGSVKAKSIQLNSGAVIDGHCSLQFADVDLNTFFE